MNNQNIKIQKKWDGKIPYLTEILPEIPTNTILYKRLTGLGATYGELKAQRNSIIIEPNKPVTVSRPPPTETLAVLCSWILIVIS